MRPHLLAMVIAFCIGIVVSLAAQAPADEISQAEEAWTHARETGNKGSYDSLLADDFTWTFITGRVVNKKQSVDNLQAAPSPVTSKDIRVYGNAAVVVGTAKLTMSGRPVTERFVRVWIKRNGRWQAVLFQATEITQ